MSNFWIECKIKVMLLILHFQAKRIARSDKSEARMWLTRWKWHEDEFPDDVKAVIDKEIHLVEEAIR